MFKAISLATSQSPNTRIMSLIHSKLQLFLGLGLLALAASAQAQLVSDGGTAVIITTTNIATDLTVGNAGPNTTLIITNGGSVTANNAVTGSSAAATNNLIAVSGAGSKLTTPGGGSVLRTGNIGAFNRLFVSEGGAVSTGFGVIGYPAAATNNTVLVTDSGSVWSNSSVVYIGEGGSGNSLTIMNAGRVVAGSSTIGVVASASNNLVLVTGTNSLWSTVNTLNVGDAGGGSQLRVSSGGTVTATGLVLGHQASSSGNRLNVGGGAVRATNAAGTAALDVRRGSVQFNGGNITADNLLLTSAQGSFTFNDGTLTTRAATINNGQSFVVGANAGAAPAGTNFANTALIRVPGTGAVGPASPYPSSISINNLAGTITKATVTVSNLSHAASYDVDMLLVSPDGTAVILMANAGDFAVTNLTLTFDDAASKPLPLNGQLTNGTYHPSTHAPRNLPFPAPLGPYSTNLATFIGASPNGTWSLFVNDAGGGDSGGITNGWSLKLVTTTPAAVWDVRSNAAPTVVASGLQIGGGGSGATLLVTNGATLSASSAAYVGYNSSAGNNRAIIAGPNSFWTSSSDLYVGLSGSGNALLITNSGRVADGYAYIGYGSLFPGESDFGNNNQVTVSGANSLWTSSGNVSVGHSGSGNSLLIANGSAVTDSIGHIGYQSIAGYNQVTVTGPNSAWSNSAGLNVGFDGSFSTLLVTDGATVSSPNVSVGASSGNVLTVGNGSLTVTNATQNGTLDVRRGSAIFTGGNITADQLLLTNGSAGTVTFNAGTLITRTATISNGLDFVVGANGGFDAATWDVRSNATPTTVNGNLYIGQSASNARLFITNGAILTSASGSVGFNVDANNNAALVTGAGSAWNNNATLYVGFAGNGNQLTVSNGASVFNTIGYLGELSGANNNRATVTGPGSQWINHNNLYVGDGGSFNSLLIANGAEVVVGNSSAIIGNASGANSNLVTVTDAGSLLRCASQKFTFGNGSFNTLLITNGGTVQTKGFDVDAGTSGENWLVIANGTLNVQESAFHMYGGSVILNGGVVNTPQLWLDGGSFTFNAGTVNVGHKVGNNGAVFTVGDGTKAATYFMSGLPSDTHLFSSGLLITNQGMLAGNGQINDGVLTVANGGTLSPGSSIGTINLRFPPTLQGKTIMEISKASGGLANDVINIGDVLTLGGSLTVTNIGPDALAAGDSFTLFTAVGPIGGAFASLSLPSLPAGLSWTNKLMLDGSIAVVNKTAPRLGGLTKAGTNLNFTVSGGSPGAPWNLLTSTNVAAPLANWITNRSGVFDWLGNASVTNGINSTEPQRYFRINAP